MQRAMHDINRQIRLNVHHDTIKQTLTTNFRAKAVETLRLAANIPPPDAPIDKFQITAKTTVFRGDWGDVLTYLVRLTKGADYAVLNMANAYQPGGGPGCQAMEENMFQRTTASVEHGISEGLEMSAWGLLHPPAYRVPLGEAAHVCKSPRILFKGSVVCDDRGLIDLTRSYRPVHPVAFWELRSAAIDTRHLDAVDFGDGKRGSKFDLETYSQSMRRRIFNQFQACKDDGITHVLLSAFGCGAFMHREIAQKATAAVCKAYREAAVAFADDFERIDFAIYSPYGANNYEVWRTHLE